MRVVLTGWKPGLLKISLSDLLRERAGYSLKSAKAAVDRLIDGEPVILLIRERMLDDFGGILTASRA